MLYTLKNNILEVSVSDIGAELISAKRGDCEYVWVAEGEDFWQSRAPIPFPVCGRFFEGKYSCRGKTYELPCHGFLRSSKMELKEQTDNSLTFELRSSEETLAVYPFEFTVYVTHTLEGDKLTTSVKIINDGKEILPATMGAHPGFNVPLDGKGSFEDYYIEFEEECSPDVVDMSERCLLTGKRYAYPLEKGKIIPLSHSLFDVDATFLARTASAATLKSAKTDRFVKIIYPDLPYFGIWHTPGTEAPFVCMEPWCGLPAYDGVCEDIETKHDMFRIEPGSSKTVSYSIIFG